ncbi:MAG: DUF1684 domain-containing protein [Thermoanaerobaculia bacterium]
MSRKLRNTLANALLMSTCGLLACQPPPAPTFDHAAWAKDLAAWRTERDGNLRKESGWLSLAGLYWLKEGPSRFGSDPANEVAFPAGKAPGQAGVFRLEGGKVRLEPEPGAGLAVDGKPIEAPLELVADADGTPTVVTLQDLSFLVIRRGDRVGIRLKDKKSPVLAQFTGMENYPDSPAWRLVARFEPYTPPRKLAVPNILGQSNEEDCPGAIVFVHEGKEFRLEPTGQASKPMSIVFGDASNGHGTYGGGRFLEVDPPAADGTVVVDFNRAYNPPCVFTPYATCPLPPRGNRLPFAVEAGERMYAKGLAHEPTAGG